MKKQNKVEIDIDFLVRSKYVLRDTDPADNPEAYRDMLYKRQQIIDDAR